jgi:hypothetical protein
MGKSSKRVMLCDLSKEPEVDIVAAIQECVNESMAKLATAIQERTDQLMDTLTAVDAAIGGVKRKP